MYQSNLMLIKHTLYTIYKDFGCGYCSVLNPYHWPMYTSMCFLLTYAHHYNYMYNDNALLCMHYFIYIVRITTPSQSEKYLESVLSRTSHPHKVNTDTSVISRPPNAVKVENGLNQCLECQHTDCKQ